MDLSKIHVYFGTKPPTLHNSEDHALGFNCIIVLHIIV
jgi:hypothetical protein